MNFRRVSYFLIVLSGLSSTVTTYGNDTVGIIRDDKTFKYTGEQVHIKDSANLITIEDILNELESQRSIDVPNLTDVLANEVGFGGKLPDVGKPQDGTIYGDYPKYTPAGIVPGDEDSVNEIIMSQMRAINIPWGAQKNFIMKYSQYDDVIAEFVALRNQTTNTKLSVALVKAIIFQESTFREGVIPGKESNGVVKKGGYGLMQIEFGPSDGSSKVHEDKFKEWVEGTLGKQVTNVRADVLNPYYNIGFGTLLLAKKLDMYPGDYAKAIQSYNYGSVDKLIKEYGEDGWLANRPNAWKVFGKSNGKYGDMKYIEHVMEAFVP